MTKLIVPRASRRGKVIYKKQNIKLINSITEKEFEDVVVQYLNQHNMLHLATCRDNEPRSTSLEYFNNGMTVYIFSEGGGKFANLKVNNRVSYSICDPYNPAEDFYAASGLQVWGIASAFKKNDDPEKYRQIRKYSRNTESLKKQGLDQAAESFNFNVITIEPQKIRYLNLRQGYRNIVWKKEK